MISDESILYIAPKHTSEHPLIDDLTRRMAAAYREGTPSEILYRGIHACVCGATSTNYDVILSNGMRTNSLCVHYLAFHRNEVPKEQIERVAALVVKKLVEPTEEELRPPRW